jgi:hypothetical protein
MPPPLPDIGTIDIGAIDIGFVVGVLLAMHVARRWAPLYALLVWPGTLLHECAHALVGWLALAQPAGLRLLPQRIAGSRRWSLGATGFRHVTWYNAVPVALAPLLLAPAALLLGAWSLGEPVRAWTHWAGLYAATALAVSCLPSRGDWTLAASRPFGLLAWIVLAAVAVLVVVAR